MSKRDPAVAPLIKRLEQVPLGRSMTIDELLLDTICKGLKAVSMSLRTGTLDRLRADDRFEVSESLGSPGGWEVSLAKPAATVSDADLRALVDEAEQATPVDDAPPADDEPPAPIAHNGNESGTLGDMSADTPTLGERLAAAEANGQPPIESTLAQPISTIATAAPEAAIPLTEQEKHDQLFAAMQKHQKQSTELAAEFFDLKRTELGQDSALKQTRETLKELQKTMASHMAAVPTLETIAQRTIAFDTECETGPGDQPQAEGGEAPAWPYQVPPEHTMSPEAAGVGIDQCIARILLEIPPGEKPLQIKEHVVTVKGSEYLPRQANPDCTRVFLQPVVSRDTWQQIHEEKFGRALKDFDQSDEAQERRQAGGEDCGRTVKVGRAVCVMGPESEGLVIVAAAPTDIPPMASVAAEDAGE